MAFQDMQSFLNRKRLIVKEIHKDTNREITSLVVDVERAEGNNHL